MSVAAANPSVRVGIALAGPDYSWPVKASTTAEREAVSPPGVAEATAPVARALSGSPVALTLVAKAAEALTLVALVTLVPRALGPADYGVFAVVLAVVGIVSMSLSLGGPILLSRFVPVVPPAQQGALALALALRIGRLRALLVTSVVVVLAVLATVAPQRFPPIVALFIGLALVLDVAATLIYQVALALGRRVLWSFRFPLQNTVLVVAVLALHAGAGQTGAVAAVAIASAGGLAACLPAVMRRLPRARALPSLPPGALRFGVLQGLGGFFVQIALRGNVPLVLLLTADKVEAGFAALATSLALAVTFAIWQLFVVELPRLSAAVDDDPAGVEASARRLARTATLVLAPIAVVGVVVAGPLLGRILGPGFRGAEEALVPALATVPLAALTALAAQIAALRLRADIRVRTTGIGAAVLVVSALIAIPQWGAVGGAAAFLAGTLAMTFASARELSGVFGKSELALGLGGAAAVILAGTLT
jgi:O-antigen/teichoic acid export membrane protein